MGDFAFGWWVSLSQADPPSVSMIGAHLHCGPNRKGLLGLLTAWEPRFWRHTPTSSPAVLPQPPPTPLPSGLPPPALLPQGPASSCPPAPGPHLLLNPCPWTLPPFWPGVSFSPLEWVWPPGAHSPEFEQTQLSPQIQPAPAQDLGLLCQAGKRAQGALLFIPEGRKKTLAE